MTAQSAELLGFQGTGVSIFPITQATAATFTDLFIGVTFLCFICAIRTRQQALAGGTGTW